MNEIFVAWKVGLLFLLFMGVFFIIYQLSKRLGKKYPKKGEAIYACGEDIKPEQLNVPTASFYTVLIRAFGLKKIKKIHSGNMTTYLIWIFAGIIILLLVLLFGW